MICLHRTASVGCSKQSVLTVLMEANRTGLCNRAKGNDQHLQLANKIAQMRLGQSHVKRCHRINLQTNLGLSQHLADGKSNVWCDRGSRALRPSVRGCAVRA